MDHLNLGAGEAAAAIRNAETTAEALAEALIERVEASKHLNAFISFDADHVREAARKADIDTRDGKGLGPLHGVPITVKDNINTLHYPTTAGTPALRGNVVPVNAPVVQKLIDAGAILFGKNTMHELAFGITSNNAAFGPARNPYDPAKIPGGSSGGTAVAVAARAAPAGIGTDTGGSVRVPAALCGVFGLRPTLGRWPQQGIVPIAFSRDTAGPIARSLADLELIDGIVTGDREALEAPDSRTIRLGVPRAYYWTVLDDETARVCENALTVLRAAGVELVETDVDDIAGLTQAVSFIVALYEPRDHITKYLQDTGSPLSFEDVVRQVASADVAATMTPMLDTATRIPDAVYAEARDVHRPRLRSALASYFAENRVDATIFPTTPLTARPIGEDETVVIGDQRLPTFPTFIRNTDPGSSAGIPGVTLPVGRARDGLPIGLALDGPLGSDRRLLAIAATLAKLFPPIEAPII